jgi:outer membrane protein assembly factor BamB
VRNIDSKTLIILGTLALAGCAGRNIHPDLTADPRVLVREWTIPTRTVFDAGERDAEFSNAVLYQGTLIFGSLNQGLIALYPSNGQVRWNLPITHGVVSPVAIENGTAFFGGGDGNVYAVNVDNGRVIWQYAVRNPIISKPTIKNGRVFLTTSDDTIYAFDAGTGQWLWHYKRRSGDSATILGASSPLVDEDDVLAGLSDGFLVCLSIHDGKLKWERKLHEGRKFTDVDAHPVLDGSTLYVPSYDGALYALNRKDGQPIWRFDSGGAKQVTIEGDRVYLPSSDGTVYTLAKQTGKVLWKFELDKGVPTQFVLTDRHLIFGSSFQYLYVIDKRDGKGLYRYNVGKGSGFYGAPAWDSQLNRLYIISGAGNLMAFQERQPPKKIFAHGQSDPYVFYTPF